MLISSLRTCHSIDKILRHSFIAALQRISYSVFSVFKAIEQPTYQFLLINNSISVLVEDSFRRWRAEHFHISPPEPLSRDLDEDLKNLAAQQVFAQAILIRSKISYLFFCAFATIDVSDN